MHQSIQRKLIDRSNQLTLQTSPNQFHHHCSLFKFAWLIKVRSIVVLHTVSSCWYTQLCLFLCFCFPLNTKVVPTSEVRLLSQREMAYCCVYHGQLFLPGFHLLTESYSCVTVSTNYNKEDLKIMSSLIQYDFNQKSDVILLILECDTFNRRWAKGNKERWYCGWCRNEYNIWNFKKKLMHLTRSGSQSISLCRYEILPK